MGGILRTLILLGAIQGFIVSVLLASAARRGLTGATAKRLLARIILLLAMACLNLWLIEMPGYLGSIAGNLINALVPLVIVMPVGPLVRLYVRGCLEPEFRLTRRHRRHFYSVAIDLFPYAASFVYVLLIIFGVIQGGKDYGFGTFLDNYNQYGDIPRWLSLCVYLGVTYRYLARMRTTVAPELRAWPLTLVRGLTGFAVLWLIHLVPYELPRYSDALIDRFGWYPLYLPIVLLIYWLGMKGYFISYRPLPAAGEAADHAAAGDQAGRTHPGSADRTHPGSVGGIHHDSATRTALDPGVVAPAVQALTKAMDLDQVWLDPALNLGALAHHCGLAPKTVSAVLNQHLEKTFSEYINEYRIAAFKQRILRPESRELTIAGLAYECGFNSLPTFQRAFKAITGLTPKEYLQKSALT